MTKQELGPLAALGALADAIPPAPAEPPEPKRVRIRQNFDPVALSGTANARFAERLAQQVIVCQPVPPDADAKTHADMATAAIGALKELTPAGAAEGMLAAQMVAVHNASLDLLRQAVADADSGRTIEERTRQYARLAEVFLKQLDRYHRQRGRQRQTIRIEHVRVVEDGKVTVRQEEERMR
ncbi:MAG: hypothetical protein ACREE7_15875 [Dongiaceae bacterium]